MKKKRIVIYVIWSVFFIILLLKHRYVLEILGDFWGLLAIFLVGICIVGPLEYLLMIDDKD
jgi:hypothetical protein